MLKEKQNLTKGRLNYDKEREILPRNKPEIILITLPLTAGSRYKSRHDILLQTNPATKELNMR